MPLILILSESDHRNRPGKGTLFFAFGILEHDSNRVIVIVVLINQQNGPLRVWAQNCIGRHQNMATIIGAIARFWVGGYISERMGTRFPYGTFVINCTGSFLIGFIITILAERTHWSANWRYLIPVGFIGA